MVEEEIMKFFPHHVLSAALCLRGLSKKIRSAMRWDASGFGKITIWNGISTVSESQVELRYGIFIL